MIRILKKSSKKREYIDERNRREYDRSKVDIDINDIMDLLEKQHWSCPITGQKLAFTALTPWKASVDRIDGTKGYTKDNIRIVVNEVNVSTTNIPGMEPNINDWAELFYDSLNPSNTYDITDFINKWNMKPSDMNIYGSYSNLNNYKKELRKVHPKYLFDKIREGFRRKIGSILTRDDLYDMYISQNGKCYYSGVQMTILPGVRRVSVERLNNIKPYTKENCVMVCRILNPGDYSGGKIEGLGMSKKKFQEILKTTPLILNK